MPIKINWDALGIATSVACAIHCAVLPLLLSSLPIFGINIIENVAFEYGMIVLAAAIGAYALYHGYRKHHHQLLPLLVFMAGIVLLLLKQAMHHLQLWFLVPAVMAIVWAHYRNFQLYRQGHHQHSSTCRH